MSIIHTKSLYKTLDNLNQKFFDGTVLSSSERNQLAKWITERQGLKGSYTNMFAPTDNDFKGIILFTGDKLTSKASSAHILGEESLRALHLLNVKDKKVQAAFDKARSGIKNVLEKNYKLGIYPLGMFCCGKCTAALWRNISAEGVNKNKKALDSGIKYLRSMRDGKGKWRRFPFFYTLLALTDIDLPSAKEELKYASELCRKYINRKDNGDNYVKRKKEIARRVLELLS
ncbi:MAG: hypothetical protein IPL53_18315 [Ignavibacteria bacterium]|nr:hypothetical protein [Ignavibacteria bacterium]